MPRAAPELTVGARKQGIGKVCHYLNGFIYKITNSVNGKVYIGQTVSKVSTRWSAHKRNARKSLNNFYITRAIQKYGEGTFVIETLAEVASEWLDALEVAFIFACKAQDCAFGYNLNVGGSGYTEWKAEQIRTAMIGRTPWNKGITGQIPWNKDITDCFSEETIREMSESRKGTPCHPNAIAALRLRTISPEHREAIKLGIAAHVVTEEERQKRSTSGTGRKMPKWTDERRDAHVPLKGELNGFYGKTHSPETRALISAANVGRVAPNKGVPVPQDVRDKIAATLMGNVPWNKGKEATEEAKRNQSLAHTGKTQSPETVAKRTAAITGLKRTDETKAKLAAVQLGRVHSDERKANNAAKQKALWADPAYRTMMLDARKAARELRKAA